MGYWSELAARPIAALRYDAADRLVDERETYLGLGGGSVQYATAGQFGAYSYDSTYAGRTGEVIPALQSAVQLLSQTLATCPRTVVDGQGRAQPGHDVTALLNHGDRRWPASAVWEYLVRSALTWGWGLAWMPRIRAAGGRLRLYPCDPVHSTVRASEDRRSLVYQLHPLVGPRRYDVPGSDVLVVVGDGYNGLRGLSPLLAYGLTTGVLRAANAHLHSTLTRGLHISGVVESSEEVGRGQGWDLPRLAELRRRLAAEFAGERAAGQVPVLPPGFAWKGVPYSAVDIELVRLLELSIEDVCRIYRVPPRLIYHYRTGIRYGSDAEQSNTEWMQFSIRPRAELMADFIGTQLLTSMERMQGLAVHIDTHRLASGTLSQRIAAMDQAVARSRLMTPNEARAYVATGVLPRLDPLEGGDELLAPKGGPAENAGPSGMESPGATPAGEETEPTQEGA